MDQMENDHCMCWKFEGLRELVDFPDIYSLIAPRYLQCQNGLKEPSNGFTPDLASKAIKEIELIYRDFDREENLELAIHNGGHEISISELMTFMNVNL
jgi:hypothetical protein